MITCQRHSHSNGKARLFYTLEDEIVSRIFCEQILDSLTQWQRIVAVMRCNGYTEGEIAEWRGCSRDNVHSALTKIKGKIGKLN